LKASIIFNQENYQLKFEDKVLNSIKLTINYFGLKNLQPNTNIFEGNLNETKLCEVVNFLKSNNYELYICDQTQVILDRISKNKNDFINKIKLLESIKNNHNTEDFKNFCLSIKNLKRELLDHQKETCYHLYKSESAANLSVPGSGKTAVVLAYYEKLKNENKIDAIFVVGPISCQHTWETEFNLTLGRDSNLTILPPNLKKRKIIYNNFLKSELYASSFATIANDVEHLKKFFKNNNFLLVIDEAHNIKKIDGIWSNAALELSKFCKYKVILTGTPMPNAFKDYYNYLDFLYGNNEIITPKEKAQIEIFIERKNYEDASTLLRKKIYPFFTRITKKRLNLSVPNFNKPILIKMNPIEYEIYYAIITKIKDYSIKDFLINKELMNKIYKARTIRLRQVCSYVRNLITAIPDEYKIGDENLVGDKNIQKLIATYDQNEKPAKLIKLKSLVNELNNKNKKVLIWSTHLKSVDLIYRELLNDNIIIKKITGSTDIDEREKIKNEFNNPSSTLNAIIATPQSCSESISLHKDCQNAIYYDINYDAAEFIQSLDRIHRVGGSEDKPVNYNFLHYENSIDIKIYERVFKKADQQMKVIENDNMTFSIPDEDDYEELYKDLKI
jgi:SNF2 family DNA or RNA helicase